MKPSSLFDLPDVLTESFLWDMELEYDHYEGSLADTIHSILCCGQPNSTNSYVIKNYWKALSEESFQKRAKSEKKSLESQLEAVSQFIS